MDLVPRRTIAGFLPILGGSVAYVLLGFVIYFFYYSLNNDIYDRRSEEGLAAVQVAFYAAFVVHIMASLSASALLASVTRTSKRRTLAIMALILAVLALPTLAILSFQNFCETNVSFPFPGMDNC